MEQRTDVKAERKTEVNEPLEQTPDVSLSNPSPPGQCMDKLREELSCAVRIFRYFVKLFNLFSFD